MTSAGNANEHFADAVIEKCRALGHPLCVGLDPHLRDIPSLFARGGMRPQDPETLTAIEAFFDAVRERLGNRVAIVKPQIAFFEQLGWRVLQLLERTVRACRESGLMVLLDAKRGDIGSTASAYASAYLNAGAVCEVDAITLSPYLGEDALEPFFKSSREAGKGIFVLVRTSNPGAAVLQDRVLSGTCDTVFETVAKQLAPRAVEMKGPATGWSSLGVVVGASHPEHAERVRQILPRSLFLVPGYGAQGGTAGEAVRGFVRGPSGLEGGVVSSSRGVLFPAAGAGATSAKSWEVAFDSSLHRALDELGNAIAAG